MVDLVQRLQAQSGPASLMAGLPPTPFAPMTGSVQAVRAPTSVSAAGSMADLGSISVPSSAVLFMPGVSGADTVPAKLPASPVIFRVPPPPPILPPANLAASTEVLPVVKVTEAPQSEDSFHSLDSDTDGSEPVNPSQVDILVPLPDSRVVAVQGYAGSPLANHALGEVTEL